MPSDKTKFSVGLFVTGGIIIGLVAVTWLGMSRFFEKGRFYVTYLSESVQGLDKDSPVKYKGVAIGRVNIIRVAPDSKLIEVILNIESGQRFDTGIVAQLKSVGITGSKFIELDLKKKGESDRSPHLSFPSEYPIIASKPSEIAELFRGIDDILRQVGAMDLEAISHKLKLILDDMHQKIYDIDMKGLSIKANTTMDKANQSLVEVDKTLARVEDIFDDNRKTINVTIRELKIVMENVNKLLEKSSSLANGPVENTLVGLEKIVMENEKTINTTLQELRTVVGNANKLLNASSSLVTGTDKSIDNFNRHQLVIAQNIEKASENLNRLIELLVQQPSQLIFGQPPAHRDVQSDNYKR